MPDEKQRKKQRNGNLLPGGVIGNKGGTGRPPNELRLKSRELFEMAILQAMDRLKAGAMTDSDLLRALEAGGKYGLGPIQPDTDSGDKVDLQV